jgi:hypothetical protein
VIGDLVARMMGLRTSGVSVHKVRDLDGEGAYLWVEQGRLPLSGSGERLAPNRCLIRRVQEGRKEGETVPAQASSKVVPL